MNATHYICTVKISWLIDWLSVVIELLLRVRISLIPRPHSLQLFNISVCNMEKLGIGPGDEAM